MQRTRDHGQRLGQLLLALAVLGLAALAPARAAAARPTEGGLWAYDPEDLVESWEEPGGRVRVHYVVAGPSTTLLDDLDENGVPDYVEEVADTAVQALELWADLGLRPPVPEAELGLEALGGSPALDVYLVDFFGNADGVFATDQCAGVPARCVGWLGIENDFAGYSYPSLTAALTTVIPHESFHAVQAAYASELPVWFSEGTATWAERVYDADAPGFLARCDDYLALSERPIDLPPPGPVQAFAYGTALWWWFLSERHGLELMDALLRASEGAPADLLGVIRAEVLEARGDDWGALWLSFVQANLATGARAGATVSHSFAEALAGVLARAEGALIDDSIQVFPVAARYYRIEHGGGPLRIAVEAEDPRLYLELHPVEGGASDGPVGDAIASWTADETPSFLAEELPAGGLWLVIARAEPTGSSKARICAGEPELVAECLGEEPGDDEGEGDGETGEGGDGESGETGWGTGEGRDAGATAGASCSLDPRRGQNPSAPLGLALVTLALARVRRSKARR